MEIQRRVGHLKAALVFISVGLLMLVFLLVPFKHQIWLAGEVRKLFEAVVKEIQENP